jgi:anti-repressor protein
MELIKISEREGQQTVSARELHAFLGNTDNPNTWFKRQAERAMLQDGEDFIAVLQESTGGRPTQDYAIKLPAAKELAMLNGSEKGKQARLYFIECERKAKQSQSPTTFLEALKIAVKLEEEKQALLLQADNLNTALDNLLEWVSIIKVAQHNRVSETVFKWQLLKSTSAQMGYQVKKAESPRFGYQNLYNVAVFRRCYPQYNYRFACKMER